MKTKNLVANPEVVAYILENQTSKSRYQIDHDLLEKSHTGKELEVAWSEVLAQDTPPVLLKQPPVTKKIALSWRGAAIMVIVSWVIFICWQIAPLTLLWLPILLLSWVGAAQNTYHKYGRHGLTLHLALNLLVVAFMLQVLAGTSSSYTQKDGLTPVACSLAAAGGLQIDRTGRLYSYECGGPKTPSRNALKIYNNDGTVLATVNTMASFNSGTYYINDIAVDSRGNLFVANSDTRVVEKYNQNGNLLKEWATDGTLEYKIADSEVKVSPQKLAVDSQDNLYVIFNKAVRKYNRNGLFLNEVAAGGGKEPYIYSPTAMTIDSNDNLYVYDTLGYTQIKKYSAQGEPLAIWKGTEHELGYSGSDTYMTIDSNGTLYFLNGGRNTIFEFDSNLKLVSKQSLPGDGTRYAEANGLAIDTNGNLYISQTAENMLDGNTQRILKLDNQGQILKTWQVTDTFPWWLVMLGLLVTAAGLLAQYIIATVKNHRAASLINLR